MEEKKSSLTHQKEKIARKKVSHNASKFKKRFILNEKNYYAFLIVLGAILVAIAIFNVIQVNPLDNVMTGKIVEAEEAAKPAKLELFTIIDSNCKDCSTVTDLVESIKNANTEITQERNLVLDSEEARAIISEYGIERIPTIILTGEIDKFNARELEKRGDALVYSQAKPPYVNPLNKKVMGKVSTILIEDSSCEECFSLRSVSTTLKQQNVVLGTEEILDRTDTKAKNLISQFGILKLPALLVSEDIDVYPFAESLQGSTIQKTDGYYVMETPIPPYFDINTKTIKGLLSITMITDNLCEDCYDVNTHKLALAQMGVTVAEEKTVDLNSVTGMALKLKYDLKKVPTIILEGDLDTYEGFDAFWKERIGTVENDGAYVFRSVELMGGEFNDLSNG